MTTLFRRYERPGGVRDERTLEEVFEGESFPLVDGTSVTFAFRGPAEEVRLRHWIHGLASSQPFKRLHGTDVWYLELELPARSRMEYKLEVVQGRQRRLIQDPLNPNVAQDPFGVNSVVHGTGYEVPDWTQVDPEAREGEVVERKIKSSAFGETRSYDVYLPARMRETRLYPLLIAHDGAEYLNFSGLKTVLDNLIHRFEIPPLIVALTGSPDRMHEYGDDPRHAEFLVDELVPDIEKTHPVSREPADRGLLGASLGAVAALSTAWRRPGFFHNLLLQSGSFAFTDIGELDGGPAMDRVAEFVNEFREDPGRPAERLFVSCGTYEALIYYNRSMIPLLQSTGMAVRYVEARDGHNWENWRDRLREGLSWLFPGPLWMVYE